MQSRWHESSPASCEDDSCSITHLGIRWTKRESELTTLQKAPWIIAGVLTVGLITSAITVSNVRSELRDTQADLAELRSELEDVETGAGNVATQVAIFTNALGNLGPETATAFDEAIEGLDSFATSQIVVDIDVSETVAIDTEFVLDREIIVPIDTVVPINETISTTIIIDGPLDTKIPVDVEVPINLDLPISLEVPILVNETIPITADIPIDLTVPISIDVADTELADFAESLRQGLVAFRDALSSFDG